MILISTESRAGTPLTTQRVAQNLSLPVFVTSPPGDRERLFIVRQGGAVHILENGVVQVTPYIQVASPATGDMGLLGFCFDPDYANNGFFYVNYAKLIGGQVHNILERYNVSASNPDLADPNSGITLIDINEGNDNGANRSHNGNMLAFGPNDGYLYAAFGDGGDPKDPQNDAQNGLVLLGKVLRLDVLNATQQAPYVIPPGNPFVNDPTHLDEIWAKGLRNPWRFSFDRQTGDFYLADVGERGREEIDFLPASDTDGANFGWCCMEGTGCSADFYSGPPNNNPMLQCTCTCGDPSLTGPVHEYTTGVNGCFSITGGYVYRGCAIPDLRGAYFFADYLCAKIWSFRLVGGQVTDFQERTAELDPPDDTINTIVSFGEDADGELYIVKRGSGGNGAVYKIVRRTGPGDMNADGLLDQTDIDLFAEALMDPDAYALAHPELLEPIGAADFTCDGLLNGNDAQPFVTALLAS